MAELKTKANSGNVKAFLDTVENGQKRADCYRLLEMIEEACGAKARMWGKSIVGCGDYHYKYASGREGDWFLLGFSPRKQNISVYIMAGAEKYRKLLDKLGKYKTGKSCIYIKRLDDVDTSVLREMMRKTVEEMS